MIKTEGNVKWNGTVLFSVFDEKEARKMGLLDNQEAFLFALENGLLPVKRRKPVKNTVTNYALQQIVLMLTTFGYNPILPNYMELGTGTGTPAPTDSDLWSASTGTLKACTSINAYLSYYAQFITTWLSTDPITGTWTEIGLKDSSGNLWAHSAITSNLTINSGEALVGQWQIQIQ